MKILTIFHFEYELNNLKRNVTVIQTLPEVFLNLLRMMDDVE